MRFNINLPFLIILTATPYGCKEKAAPQTEPRFDSTSPLKSPPKMEAAYPPKDDRLLRPATQTKEKIDTSSEENQNETENKSDTRSKMPRKDIWTTEPFRCRAVSTTRFRPCRFQSVDNGYRIQFKKVDIACNDVVFDANGDPAVLKECQANWLRIPKTAKLKSNTAKTMWSGSNSGWSWKDGDKYCCPGIWIEAPKSLQK